MLEGTPAEKAARILEAARCDRECESEDRHDAFDQWLGAQPWEEHGLLRQVTYSLANGEHREERGDEATTARKQRAQAAWNEARPHLRAYWENARTSSYTGWSRHSDGPVRKTSSRPNPITVEQAAVLEELEAAQNRVNRHETELGQRDEAIRAGLASGLSAMDMVNRTGLVRQRIYQIRDGVR